MVSDMVRLLEVNGFVPLEFVATLQITNLGITTSSGVFVLNFVEGSFRIESNRFLESVADFSSLTREGIQGFTLILNNRLLD